MVGRAVDVALRLGPLNDSSLKAKRIAKVNRSIIGTPEYLATVGEIKDLADLARCTWIGRKNPATLPVIYAPNGERYTLDRQPKFLRVNSVQAVKKLVLAHNGVGLFSDMLVEQELASGRAVRLLPSWEVENMTMYAVWPAQKTTGQLVKKFIDFLTKELDEM